MPHTRPLSSGEIGYLKRFKSSLDASWQALLITLGLLALPLAFLGFSVAGHGEGDRVAMVLAGLILVGLIGGVIYYSARGRAHRKLDLADAARFKGLLADLAHPEALSESTTITGKDIRRKGRTEEGEARKEYWLVAGDRRYQVSPEHYMALSVGETVQIEYARESKIVLTVNGENDRIPLSLFGREQLEMDSLG